MRTPAPVPHRHRLGRRGRPRAFTIVELLVVIGLVVLLVGITLQVTARVMLTAEVTTTENTLRLLDTAVAEWELNANRQFTWGIDGQPHPSSRYEVEADHPFQFTICDMVAVLSRSAPARSILARIDDAFLYRYEAGVYPHWLPAPSERQLMDAEYDGALTILDAWGEPIYALHPGTPGVTSLHGTDRDGTERTLNETYFGIARERHVTFVSAGPDGEFGWMAAPAGHELFEKTRDNILSYPVDFPPTH